VSDIVLPKALALTLELLVLGGLLFVALRTLRQARGSKLLRGLLMTVVLGGAGFWILVEWLDLEELRHILKSVTGIALVVGAIVFQPELRRTISEFGRTGKSERGRVPKGSLDQVCAAVRRMSKSKVGALIALECDTPLDPWIEPAVAVNAPVGQLMLESIFQPGGSLHDGAVILRQGKIAAASCLLPLSENAAIRRNYGTRHRAGLGLTEETDATAIIVSEETGRITLCRRGVMNGPIAPKDLDGVLRTTLGRALDDGRENAQRSTGARAFDLLRRDGPWLALSFLLAGAWLWVANQALSETRELELRLIEVSEADAGAPDAGQLFVRLPDDSVEFTGPQSAVVSVTGTRGQLDRLRSSLSGELRIEASPGARVDARTRDVAWTGPGAGDLRLSWGSDGRLPLNFRSLLQLDWDLDERSLTLDVGALEGLYDADLAEATWSPTRLELRGPRSIIESLGSDNPVRLEPLRPNRRRTETFVAELGLAAELRQAGLELLNGPVRVELPVRPVDRDLGELNLEVALVCMDPARAALLEAYRLPSHQERSRWSLRAEALFTTDALEDDQALKALSERLREFASAELLVYVDLAELPDDGSGGRSLPVRHHWRRRPDEALAELGLDGLRSSGSERLVVELLSDAEVLLEALP
jgi:diadenylate cyclase